MENSFNEAEAAAQVIDGEFKEVDEAPVTDKF